MASAILRSSHDCQCESCRVQVPIEERERLLLKAGLDPAELTNLTLVYQDPLTQVCVGHTRAILACRPSQPSVDSTGQRLIQLRMSLMHRLRWA